jgi:hypothetical protein
MLLQLRRREQHITEQHIASALLYLCIHVTTSGPPPRASSSVATGSDRYDVPIELERQVDMRWEAVTLPQFPRCPVSLYRVWVSGLVSILCAGRRKSQTSLQSFSTRLSLAIVSSDRRFRPRSARRSVPSRLQTAEGQCLAMTSSLVTRCGSAPPCNLVMSYATNELSGCVSSCVKPCGRFEPRCAILAPHQAADVTLLRGQSPSGCCAILSRCSA